MFNRNSKFSEFGMIYKGIPASVATIEQGTQTHIESVNERTAASELDEFLNEAEADDNAHAGPRPGGGKFDMRPRSLMAHAQTALMANQFVIEKYKDEAERPTEQC